MTIKVLATYTSFCVEQCERMEANYNWMSLNIIIYFLEGEVDMVDGSSTMLVDEHQPNKDEYDTIDGPKVWKCFLQL